jgi:hypothetical protein
MRGISLLYLCLSLLLPAAKWLAGEIDSHAGLRAHVPG